MKPLFLICLVLVLGACIGGSIGALMPGPRSHVADITELQSMVREAAIFGWRCHERGSEDECAAAVLRIVGGGT